ncbi:MAG: cation:proton antiporter [Chloroflexi bacterium]|nr:cation:proton antiporter [Chloroflexota bacterium]
MEEGHVLELLVVIAIILVAAKGSGIIAVRLGQPAVLGELSAGVILGPSVLNMFGWDYLSAPALEDTTLTLAGLGVVFLMFLAGLETDLDEVNKVRKVAFLAGAMGVVFPLALGTAVTLPFDFTMKEAIFAGIILSATSVSISARTLMELGVLQGRQGISILAAAVIDDVFVILILSFFVAFAVESGDGGGGTAEVLLIIGRVLLFFIVALIVGLFVLPPLARWSANASMSEGVIATALVVILLSAWFSEYVGEVAMITGAFLAGIFLRRTDVHSIINDKMHTISYGFFVPIFFVGVGLSADASNFEGSDVLLLIAITAIAVASKIVGSGLGARLAGEGTRSSIQIGVGMVSRGEVGLIVATVGLNQGLVDTNLFSVMVLMVLATTLITPILLKIVFSGDQEVEHLEEEHV